MSDYAIDDDGDRVTLRLGGDNVSGLFLLGGAILGAWAVVISLGSPCPPKGTPVTGACAGLGSLPIAILLTLGFGAVGVVLLLHHGRRVIIDRTLQTLTMETVWAFGTRGTTITPWSAIRAVQVNYLPMYGDGDGWEVAIRTDWDDGPVRIADNGMPEPVRELAEIIARMVDRTVEVTPNPGEAEQPHAPAATAPAESLVAESEDFRAYAAQALAVDCLVPFGTVLDRWRADRGRWVPQRSELVHVFGQEQQQAERRGAERERAPS